jgi:hypothetical protein
MINQNIILKNEKKVKKIIYASFKLGIHCPNTVGGERDFEHDSHMIKSSSD